MPDRRCVFDKTAEIEEFLDNLDFGVVSCRKSQSPDIESKCYLVFLDHSFLNQLKPNN